MRATVASNRRSNINFYMQLSEKKEDSQALTSSNTDNKILSSTSNKELAKLKEKLGLEEDSSGGWRVVVRLEW